MILHIDLDSFFVSAHRIYESRLRGVPVAVGGCGDIHIFDKARTNQHLDMRNSGAFLGAFFQKYEASAGDDIAKFIDDKGRVRGIVTTASYEARRYGVTTGMSIAEALRHCPNIIVKAPDMALYKRLSHKLHRYIQQQIPLIEQVSIDEFYGDVSGWIAQDEIEYFIDMLRHQIKRELHLPPFPHTPSPKKYIFS